MKKIFLLFFSFVFFSNSVLAQALPLSQNQLCEKLVRHVPDADVAFQPGVDLKGRPVVPADLNAGSSIEIPETIEIPLTVDLARRLRVPAPQGIEMEVLIGFLQITKEGRVLQNGRDLTDQAVYLCKDSDKTDASKEMTHEPTSPKSTSLKSTHSY